ncbi:phenolpthiocerol synthesis type-I polyketide synthase ppsB [Mycobacteroides abscessus subsp. abscessus]|uniref:SDR family NAD(P)-dependent oxidoreductase n=1 Tax=Mycobacteroides abscessus TaxID=36809 RepID=UPI00092C03D1|nr:SDR family NAD(P)-dependent oxidoreductase [Mycobacteroides abscessus]SHS51826.1 phenolpthiocerol synthesis type-I polyketide synthase ppsB [Mycobacteroides abscessus subsp. abscessus]
MTSPKPPVSVAPNTVAVVGMGLVAPGVNSPQDFWHILNSETNALTELRHLRLENWFNNDHSAPDKTYVRTTGMLNSFEAHKVLRSEQDLGYWHGADPTTLLLRHSLLQALESVTVRPHDRYGAYLGAQPGGLALEESVLLSTARSVVKSSTAARHLDSHYPFSSDRPADAFPERMLRTACRGLLPDDSDLLVIDTACSSSLYAIDLGVKSLLSGDRDVVLCGGANTGSRRDLVLFAKLGALAPGREIRALDSAAAGVLFSDAAAVLALKTLDRAQSDGDEILLLLGGFGASVDGEGSVMASSPAGQRLALERARLVNNIAADTVSWIVTHGTGTRLGDAVELETLNSTAGTDKLLCTSNKPLIGHGAWAAGATNVIHAALAAQYREIPAERYFDSLPDNTSADRIIVPVQPVPWSPTGAGPRLAGVCAYGFGGTNAHLIVQAPDSRYAPPRSARVSLNEAHSDPMVLIGSSTWFPGEFSREEIVQWLHDDGASPPRSFGDQYPLPPFSELRMPPVSARSIDRTQLMALAAVREFVTEHGLLWNEMRDRTGVFTGHSGPTKCMVDYTVRIGADDLRAVVSCLPGIAAHDIDALEQALSSLAERLPAANERSMTGQLTNIISSMVVNRYRLRGLAMNIDCGKSSTQGALHVAERYLSSRDLDFAIVIGLCGNSTSMLAELVGNPHDELAEGAVMLALTRKSVADEHRWPIRAIVRTDAARSGQHAGVPAVRGRTYLGADGAIATLRALDLGSPDPAVLRNDDPAPRVEISCVPPAAACLETPERSVVVLRRADSPTHGDVLTTATRPATLFLTHDARLAEELESIVKECNSMHLICTDPRAAPSSGITVASGPASQEALASAVEAMGTDVRHVLIVASARVAQAAWPAPPPPELLLLQEYALAAAARLASGPRGPQRSITALLMDPLLHGNIHPHLTLITGLLRSFTHELPHPVYAVVTDAPLLKGLDQLAAESAAPHTRNIVQYRHDHRYVEQLCPAPLLMSRAHGVLDLPDRPVIVATGGARGATAVAVTAIVKHTPSSVWLLGTTSIHEIAHDLVDAPDRELNAQRAQFLTRELAKDPKRSVVSLNRLFDKHLRVREIRQTLGTLEKLCGAENVHYLTCDLREREQVKLAAKTVYNAVGRVDLLVHGAGRIRSAGLAHKSIADFQEIRDIKVAGYHNLKVAFSDPAPTLWCNFGSGNALLGCAGDSDYVAANEYLCAAARYADMSEFTVGWGLWTETGMVKDLAAQLRRQNGFTGISNEIGASLIAAELAHPRPLDSVPFYGISVPWHSGSVESVDPLLGSPDSLTASSGAWCWKPDPVRDSYLGEHLVDGRPVLPAAMMLAMAAEAALQLHPGPRVTAFTDLSIEEPVYTGTGTPRCRITAQIKAPNAIHAEIRSDVVAADGRVLRKNRLHCGVDVHIGQPPPELSAPSLIEREPLPADTATRPDVFVQLTGVWDTIYAPSADSRGGSARCRPQADRDSIFAQLKIPALLLDSAFRLFAYPPLPDGSLAVAMPTRCERIDCYTNDTDIALAGQYPSGMNLSYDAERNRTTAWSGDHVLLRVTGLTLHVVQTVPLTIPNQEWQP